MAAGAARARCVETLWRWAISPFTSADMTDVWGMCITLQQHVSLGRVSTVAMYAQCARRVKRRDTVGSNSFLCPRQCYV